MNVLMKKFLTVALVSTSLGASAQHWVSSDGKPWTTGSNTCWGSTENAGKGCDGWLVPTPAQKNQQPAPSATTAAAVIEPQTSRSEVSPTQNWVSSDGKPWKNSSDKCWRTNSWTPESSEKSCDGALVAMPTPAAAEPPPPPPTAVAQQAPVAVAPPPTADEPQQAPPAPVVQQVPVAVVKPKSKALKLDTYISFNFDTATLTKEGKETLSGMLSGLNNANVKEVVVYGHTDSVGSEKYNQTLSERRAQSVADYLVLNGIPYSAIRAEGKGESEPAASNKTKEGRAQNRRVEMSVTAVQQQ